MVGRLIKIVLLVGVIALIGIALFRPATLFGVSGKALANSLGNEVQHLDGDCIDEGSDHWRCALHGEGGVSVGYALTTHSWGCWSGSLTGEPRGMATPPAPEVSGCIGLADEFGR